MPLFSLAIFTAIVFFIAVPTFLFLYSLIEYRKIRRIVIRSTSAQFLSEDMKKGDYCRLFGQFDGFKDDDEIWIQTDQALVKVKMRHGKVIFLPERVNEIPSGFFGVRIPGSLKILKWKKINNLEFKTKIFLFGEIQKADGVYVFDASDPKTLLVLYEGVPEDIDKELVVQSKNRYTYFQSPSLSALFIGSLMMCLISIFEYQFSGFSFMFFLYLLTAFVPVLFFAPPGCLFLLLSYRLKYKIFLLRHDYYFHYFNSERSESDTRRYWKKLWIFEIAGVTTAVLAGVINFFLYLGMVYFLVP